MLRLRDDQWERIREHFPEEHISESRPGRKHVPTRDALETVLWILNTGAQWHIQPQCYPNYKTVHRRSLANHVITARPQTSTGAGSVVPIPRRVASPRPDHPWRKRWLPERAPHSAAATT